MSSQLLICANGCQHDRKFVEAGTHVSAKAILNTPEFWSHSSMLILLEARRPCISNFVFGLSMLHALNFALLHKAPLHSGPAIVRRLVTTCTQLANWPPQVQSHAQAHHGCTGAQYSKTPWGAKSRPRNVIQIKCSWNAIRGNHLDFVIHLTSSQRQCWLTGGLH